VAKIDYLFPYAEKPEYWNQQVHVFLLTKWMNKPKESEEILPRWFNFNDIPSGVDKMWSDYNYWLPSILKGDALRCYFLFNKELEVEDYKIEKL